MNTPEQYHAQYPIGTRWLLPVTVDRHYHPDADDYDPRPIRLRTEGLSYITPKTWALDHLQPITPPCGGEDAPTITLTVPITLSTGAAATLAALAAAANLSLNDYIIQHLTPKN